MQTNSHICPESPKVENERQRKARLPQVLHRAHPPALMARTQAHSSVLQGSQGMDAPAARTSEMDPSTALQQLHWYKIPKYVIQTGPGMPEMPALTQYRFNSAMQSRTCLRGNKRFTMPWLYHDQHFLGMHLGLTCAS